MKEYILFSPVGMSDPTRGFRDGSLIHICRFYKPRKVYLYMSQEVCSYDEKDNRYEEYIKLLAKKLDFQCDVEKIKRPELKNVNTFDGYYQDFNQEIERIKMERGEAEILVNLSSGTPQMKADLRLISNFINVPIHLVQVNTPEGKANESKPVSSDYDLEVEWELNEDNLSDNPVNRCVEIRSENLNALLKRDLINKHIAVYDYQAALIVAESIKELINEELIKLLEAGARRLNLETGRASMLAQQVGYNLLPIPSKKDSRERDIFEYYLMLEIKLKRGELADFVRAVSPLLTDMFELYLERKCGININSFCKINNKNGVKIREFNRELFCEELLQFMDDYFKPLRDREIPATANLLPLILLKGKEKKAIELAKELREFEKRVRNVAAHQIISITDEWLYSYSDYKSQDVIRMLKNFISLIIDVPKSAWSSYDQLNERIINMPLYKV